MNILNINEFNYAMYEILIRLTLHGYLLFTNYDIYANIAGVTKFNLYPDDVSPHLHY